MPKLWPTPQRRDGDPRGAQAKRYHNPARSNDLPDAVAASTSSAEDFPVSPGLWLDAKQEQTTVATSGRKCAELLPMLNLDGSLVKMSEALFQTPWASTAVSLIWRHSATPANHSLFRLVPLTPRTDETASGLWHTPSSQEPGVRAERLVTKNGEPAKVGERAYDKETGRLAQVGLTQQVKMGLWRTPNASMMSGGAANGEDRLAQGHALQLTDQVNTPSLWPTPTTQDAANNGGPSQHDRNTLPLNALVQYPDEEIKEKLGQRAWDKMYPGAAKGRGQASADERSRLGGSLNPAWVSWLMGYPLDWFDGLENPKESQE